MPKAILTTDRLVLRGWRDEDWPDFFAHTNTPAVMRWLGGVMDEAKQAAQRKRIEDGFAAHGFGFWAVEREMDGVLLGFCGLKRANQPGGPQGDHEIGWRFREDAWGQGFARESALAVRDYAFSTLGAPHLIALTVAENTASWGLMQRIGLRRRPEWDFASADFGTDTIIAYSMDHADWAALKQEQTQ